MTGSHVVRRERFRARGLGMKATAYEQLRNSAREIALLGSTASVLGWDQETYMPGGGVDYRAKQIAWLSARAHAQFTGTRFRRLLDAAEKEVAKGNPLGRANVREWRLDLERAVRIPTALVAEETETAARAKQAWAEARKRSDFGLFAPHLESILRIARKKAALWGYPDEPYDALLAGYERGTRTRDVAVLFDGLRPRLAKIARRAVKKSSAVSPGVLRGRYPVEKQQQLNREVAESIGFDFERGRIDTTAHPFCTTLGPSDVRLTTRYDVSDFTSSLFGVLHEAGHGLYEQGLPAEEFGAPAGSAVSLGIHESQSRLWENHVGRSEAFWDRWLPRARELFPNLRRVEAGDFLCAVNRAEFSFIRVEADEATYDLHILLRFDLERRLLSGELEVGGIPDAWNAGFEELFGLTPPDAARGCLQDIHWSMGGLGYFPTYTLGNLNAAQLFRTAMQERSVASGFRAGDYGPLLAWLRTSVHAQGATLSPRELVKKATGRVPDPADYLAHLEKRFA